MYLGCPIEILRFPSERGDASATTATCIQWIFILLQKGASTEVWSDKSFMVSLEIADPLAVTAHCVKTVFYLASFLLLRLVKWHDVM